MKNVKGALICIVALWCGTGIAAWSNLGGGDHGGTNWVIAGGTYIASNHYNIGTVTIATGATVYVQPYSSSQYGWVQIGASNITISGTLDASGAGYLGGNGGAGGNGGTADPSNGGPGSAGSVGSGLYGGVAGGSGQGGGVGGGYNGGVGGDGGMGGYAFVGSQGDTSTAESVWMGSGGGGGGGGGAGWHCATQGSSGGGGGGAGNRGGGYIILCASNAITVNGSVFAKGLSSATANGGTGVTGGLPYGTGGTGGSTSGSGTSSGGPGGGYLLGYYGQGGAGGSGAGGAGGGLLLKASIVNILGATINNLGGGNAVTNGGTLKVFYVGYQGGSLTNTGRTYLKQLNIPEVGTIFEF